MPSQKPKLPKFHDALPAFIVAFTLSVGSGQGAYAQSADVTATELGKLLSEFVMATFTCQDYLGGRGHYEVALSDTEATMIRLGIPKLDAAETIDAIAKKLMADRPDRQLVERVKSSKTVAYTDVASSCLDSVIELQRQIKLRKLRLGLE